MPQLKAKQYACAFQTRCRSEPSETVHRTSSIFGASVGTGDRTSKALKHMTRYVQCNDQLYVVIEIK